MMLYRNRSANFIPLFPTKSPANPLIVPSISSKPICCRPHQTSPFLPSKDSSSVADALVSIFTKQPFNPDSTELKDLGSKLTTHVVETVVKGLRSWKIAQIFFKWASNQSGFRHNGYTYNAMAATLSRARQNAPLKALANDLIVSNCYLTPGALGFFLRCMGIQGLSAEANAFFDQSVKLGLCVPNNYSYNCLLEAVSKTGDVPLAEARLDEMRGSGWPIDKYTLTPVLQCYCKAGKFDKAMDVFNEMYQKGWADAHVCSALLTSFSKCGEVDKAFQFIMRMDNLEIRMNEKTFYVLIHGFMKLDRLDYALNLLNKMLTMNLRPGISIYAVLIKGLCRSKNFEKALHLYLQMQESGLKYDVNILAELVSCAHGENEMVQLLDKGRNVLGVEDRALLLSSVIKALVSCNFVDKACMLLKEAVLESYANFDKDRFDISKDYVVPYTKSFETVIEGLCRTNKLELALGLFQDMIRVGCKRSLSLYNNLIDCLGNSDRERECFELLNEMKESGLHPTSFTYNSIFGCLCRKEDIVGSLKMVKEMRLHGFDPWIKHYTLLAKKLSAHGRAVEASEFLADLVQEGLLPDIVAYSAVLDGFVRVGELDRAQHLFRDMCARGYSPDVVAYNILICGLCKEKRVQEAQDIMQEMLDKGLIPSVVTYTTLIDGYCNAENTDEAMKLWVEMQQKGVSPNRISYMAFINGLCRCGKVEDAMAYLHEMEERKMTPDSYVLISLLDAFVSGSNLNVACGLLEKIVHNGTLPDVGDKQHSTVSTAISALSKDPEIGLTVKSLIAKGLIPKHFINSY